MYNKFNSPGLRIAVLSRLHNSIADNHFKKLDIKYSYVPYIIEVLNNPGITQSEIVKKINIDKAAATRTIAGLENDGFLERVEPENNKRIKKIFPTELLLSVKDEFFNTLKSVNDLFFEGFTEEEKNISIQLMNKIIKNLMTHMGKNIDPHFEAE